MKTKEYTIINDCIYGQIKIEYPFNKIIECEDMTRLKEIKQNGYSYLAKGREGLKKDNRYNHSIGVFYLMKKAIEHIENQLNKYGIQVSNDDKNIAKAAMLLHDVGHGPYSHLAENVTEYSHEQRTSDFILQKTRLNSLLKKYFGDKSVIKIAKFISEENQETKEKNFDSDSSLFFVLKSLIANQVDVDRIDYTLRDSYYAGIKSGVDYNEIIKSFIVTLNSNNEMEIVVQNDNLRNIEQLLFERFENYRDIYYNQEAKIKDELFKIIIERTAKLYKNSITPLATKNMNYVEIKFKLNELNKQSKTNIFLSDNFVELITKPKNININTYKSLVDNVIETNFNILNKFSNDKLLKYLTGKEILNDYTESYILPIEKIQDNLKNLNLEGSIITSKNKITLYKQPENNYGIKVVDSNGNISDLSEISPLISKKMVVYSPIYYNIKLLAFINNLDTEFVKKKFDLIKEDSEKQNDEFELKYVLDDTNFINNQKIIDVLAKNSFTIYSTDDRENCDYYYDDKDMSNLKIGSSIRIRQTIRNQSIKTKATIKAIKSLGSIYSDRSEIEGNLTENSFENLKNFMREKGFDPSNLIEKPILNIITQRQNTYLVRGKDTVCISMDNSKYINLINGKIAYDKMIEIENKGGVEGRFVLNDIYNIISTELGVKNTNKDNKPTRALKLTCN